MPTDTMTQVLDLLRERRAVLRAELEQVEEALAALTKSSVARTTEPLAPAPTRASGPSVRVRVLGLLDAEDRDWSTQEVIDHFKEMGQPIKATDPSNAVRSALADAKKKGDLYSTALGRYKSAKWVSPEKVAVQQANFVYDNDHSTQEAAMAT